MTASTGRTGALRIFFATAAIAAAIAGAHGVVRARAAEPAPARPLQVTLERLGTFYYTGDPVLVRIAVFNTGDAPYDNSKGIDLVGQLAVAEARGGAALKRKSLAAADVKLQPAMIPAGGFFGLVADLRSIVDGLDKPGRYTARFLMGELASEDVALVLIPRYEPKVAYRATIETDYGRLVFDLLGKDAPRHVHNFFDLANQGYYDGTLFHVVVKGIELRGGDRTGDGSSGPGYALEPETAAAEKHHRGTLSMVRGGPTDHGAQFLISLGENPAVDGMLSLFGVLAEGEDALGALENLPTSGRRDWPFYRPLKEIRIRSIKVAAAPDGSKATAEAGAATAPSAP